MFGELNGVVILGRAMKKDLRTFINENRSAFDQANPPEELWQRISADLPPHGQPAGRVVAIKRTEILQVLKVAAITFLIGTVGITIFFYGKKQAYEDYSRINPGLAAEQATYVRLVSQKKDSIAYLASTDPVLYNEFSEVLQQMETNYEKLKQEFAASPNKEMTLEAMILNLQAQINVLSQQMDIYRDYIKQTKKQTKNEQI